jgi:hypothetical protein
VEVGTGLALVEKSADFRKFFPFSLIFKEEYLAVSVFLRINHIGDTFSVLQRQYLAK